MSCCHNTQSRQQIDRAQRATSDFPCRSFPLVCMSPWFHYNTARTVITAHNIYDTRHVPTTASSTVQAIIPGKQQTSHGSHVRETENLGVHLTLPAFFRAPSRPGGLPTIRRGGQELAQNSTKAIPTSRSSRGLGVCAYQGHTRSIHAMVHSRQLQRTGTTSSRNHR